MVSSEHPGVGKSLVVRRLTEELEMLPNNQLVVEVMLQEGEETPRLCVTIPFHDKHAHVADAVGFFLPHALHSDIPLSRIFHLDRSCVVSLFNSIHSCIFFSGKRKTLTQNGCKFLKKIVALEYRTFREYFFQTSSKTSPKE